MRLDQLQPRLRPLARVQRDRDAALEQRLQRRLDEALGAAVRRVALADDREPHQRSAALGFGAAARRAPRARARPAASSGTRRPCRRRSRRCRRAGTDARSRRRRGAAPATAPTRSRRTARTARRPASPSPRRCASAPNRRRRTRARRAVSARQLGRRQLPAEIGDARARAGSLRREDRVDQRALARVRRAGDDDAPARRRRCARAAPRSARPAST